MQVALDKSVCQMRACTRRTSDSDLTLVQVFNHYTLTYSWGNHTQTCLQTSLWFRRSDCVLYFQEMLGLQLPAGWCFLDCRAGGVDTCQDVTHLYPHHDLWAICELLPHYLVLHISFFKHSLKNGGEVLSSLIITLQACVSSEVSIPCRHYNDHVLQRSQSRLAQDLRRKGRSSLSAFESHEKNMDHFHTFTVRIEAQTQSVKPLDPVDTVNWTWPEPKIVFLQLVLSRM